MLKLGNIQRRPRDAAAGAWAAQGAAALQRGAFDTARNSFQAAIKLDRRNPHVRYQLAIALSALGKRSEAAENLTAALALAPEMEVAARELNALLDAGKLQGEPRLDAVGVIAALAFDTIDRDLLSAAIYHHLAKSEPLRAVFALGEQNGWLTAAEEVCLGRHRKLLKNTLLLAVLPRGLVARRDFEKLLSAIRRTIILHPEINFGRDKSLTDFTVALARQCWLNEFVWAESEAERSALNALKSSLASRAPNDAGAGFDLVKSSLYGHELLASANDDDFMSITSCAGPEFAAALRELALEHKDVDARGRAVPDLCPVTGSLSLEVAEQYERHPYPRWTSVPVSPEGAYLKQLKQHFRAGQLDFTRGPFDVLIAGCGTGRQAISAALDYGPEARVLGIDISRQSLGYASRMADRMGARNLTLARGDLEHLSEAIPSLHGRFHVIECTGVLHHMAAPFEAWRNLLTCLAPGGIMLIGLYSRTARNNLALLKAEPGFPGPKADDVALRAYRQELLDRPGQWPGIEHTTSRDFYSASGFRDYLMHVNEHTCTLTEIAEFLDANKLEFRGFVSPPFAALKSAFPAEIFPGSLSRWGQWEAARPMAFAGMYQFWCTAKDHTPNRAEAGNAKSPRPGEGPRAKSVTPLWGG